MISTLHLQILQLFSKWEAWVAMLILCFSSVSGQVANYDEISIEKLKMFVDSSEYYQKRAGQVAESTTYLRKELAGKKDSMAKSSLEREILSMEELYMNYLQMAREYYQKAKATGIPFSEIADPVKEEDIVDHKKNIIAMPVLSEDIDLEEDKQVENDVDSLLVIDLEEIEDEGAVSITSSYIYEFQILNSEQDKLSLSLNEPLPSGVIYRIQIGIFKKLDSGKFFKGIQPVMAESIEGKDVIRYSVGLFSHYNDAEEALVKVKEKGFTDAFIVAYYDQVRVKLKYARALESGKNSEDSNPK